MAKKKIYNPPTDEKTLGADGKQPKISFTQTPLRWSKLAIIGKRQPGWELRSMLYASKGDCRGVVGYVQIAELISTNGFDYTKPDRIKAFRILRSVGQETLGKHALRGLELSIGEQKLLRYTPDLDVKAQLNQSRSF